jgi:Colicin V production protein
MISLLVVFYMFLGLFSLMGAMRGWAKEMLVIFSVVLALAFIVVMETYIPFVNEFLKINPDIQLWFRVGTVMVFAFFGYASPRISRIGQATEKKERLQDILLGAILGIVSGYMVIGSIWSFINEAGYPADFVIPPSSQWPLGEATLRVLKILPPVWLGQPPTIYIAMVFAFLIVIIVFV